MAFRNLRKWDVVGSTVLHSTPWIEVVEDVCRVEDKQLTYTYTRRIDEGPLIIAEESDKSLWMVRQYRHPIKKTIWQFPGEGKLEHETWEDAARRGLREELHLEATKLKELGLYYVDPGGLDQKYQAYIATELSVYNGQDDIRHREEIEDLEVERFSRKDINSLIEKGEICDNWTLAALFLYDRFNTQS